MESKRRLTLDDIVEIGFKEYPISMENDVLDESGEDEAYLVNAERSSYIFGYLAGYGLKHSTSEVNDAIDRFYLNNNK